MKKIYCIAFLIVVTNILLLNSQPRLTFQISGGYSMPMMELQGDLPADSANLVLYQWDKNAYSNTYHTNSGFNIGLTGKLGFGKEANLRLTFGGAFKLFTNSEEISTATSITEIRPKMQIISLALGAEYAIRTTKMFTPYLNLEFTGNFIGGEETRTVTPSTGNAFDSTWNLESSNRFGFGVGAGLDISFLRYFGINLGVKYSMMNLFGKDANTSVVQWTNVEQPLNDKEYTYNNNSYSAKNIADLQFNLGISLFFLHLGKSK